MNARPDETFESAVPEEDPQDRLRRGLALSPSADTQEGPSDNRAAEPTDDEEAARRLSDEEDRKSVRQFTAGDSAGFEALYLKYRERVFAVLLRTLRDREDALEGTQEVFIKIHRALPNYDPRARFFTWAYRIAMNHAIDRIRRRKVRKEQMFDESFTEPGDDRSSHRFEKAGVALEAEEVRERINSAVASLSEKHRQVFVLFSYEGLGYAEIAETLEVPVGTVMSRLYHARRKVREQLPQDWDPGGAERSRETPAQGDSKGATSSRQESGEERR